MGKVQFRGLSERGIIRDPLPSQLDLSSWSAGRNVMFHGALARRAPGFRTVYSGLPSSPYGMRCVRPPTGNDAAYVFGDLQDIRKYSGGAVTDVSPSPSPALVTSKHITSDYLGQVVVYNDPVTVPLYYGPASARFATLPGWDATWRCRSLRAFGNQLVALNVTKGATSYGNLVKVSDLAVNGSPPASWDHTDPTKSALENPLEDLTTPLVDGAALRNIFCLYSSDEVYKMVPVGGALLFDFKPLFHSRGVINVNCVVEAGGFHYVFGPDDIYRHDGVNEESIVDKINRDAIFSNLNASASKACFAAYLPRFKSILFAYQASSTEAAWPLSYPTNQGCNAGAIYSLVNHTWTFVDLPSVVAAGSMSVSGAYTYASYPAGSTYATFGGSYWSSESSQDSQVVFASSAATVGSTAYTTQNRLLAYDYVNEGAIPLPLLSEASFTAYMERSGLDLDDVGADLEEYKLVRRVYPQVKLLGTTPITIRLGHAAVPDGAYTYLPDATFDPKTAYKVDKMVPGRYISIRFQQAAQEDFKLGGFDFDVESNGRR